MMPQTATPSRVPEAPSDEGTVIGPIRIHTPPPPRPVAYSDAPPPAPAGGMKPLAYLKYRWVTVLFGGGFLAVGLAFAAWSLLPSKYTTSSMIRVFSDEQVIHAKENVQGRNDFATYLKTQAGMIRSNFVLAAALRDPAVAALPMLREQPDPARFLEEQLLIEYQEGSEIIKISLSGDDPKAIAMIVNAVQEAFFREVVGEEILRKKARLKQLEDAIGKMQDEVKNRFGQLKQVDGAEPKSEPIPGLGAQLAAGQVIRLKELQGKIEVELKTWEAEKSSLEKKLTNVADEVPPPPAGYLEAIETDARMQTLSRKIELKTSRIDYLIQASGDPNLESARELKRQVAEAKAEQEKLRKERSDAHHKAQLPVEEKKLKADLERSKLALAQLAEQKAAAGRSVTEYQAALAGTQVEDKPTDFPRIDLRERAKIITEMIDKANLLRLEVSAPPRVRDFQRAPVPMKKEMKKQILGTVAAALIGFGLVGLGVIVHEGRVRRAMSLADVRNAVIGPVAGALPAPPPGADESAAAEAAAEAVEKTRTQVLQQFARAGGKVIAVTSALTEEGKSFLALELARGFARAGCRTLLVDFDLRAPSLHRRLGLVNERGLCEGLAGTLDIREAIQIVPGGMAFLAAGAWAGEVRAGLTSERVEALVGWMRQQFDAVVINTHPVLAVAESFLVCRSADGVLLSVERHESRLPLVGRAHEKLAALAPEAFGVVYQGATPEECLQ
jgi:succinoglycan biosynthesis transport protein ExoP